MLPSGSRGEYCEAHGGNWAIDRETKNSMRNYNLTKWRAQVAKKTDNEGIKSLRDEIAILRVVLEERLNRCSDATDLILQSGPISDMVMKIERVVTSCHKLEGSMGQLLDKQAILQFATLVIGIVSEEVADEASIEKISDRLLQAIGRMGEV